VKELRVGQKVDLEVLEGPYASTFSSYVIGVDEGAVSVVHPMIGGRVVPLQSGELIRIEYPVKGSSRLSFTTQVLDLDDRILPVVLLVPPVADQIRRYQQREFYRLDVKLELIYSITHSPTNEPVPEKNFRSWTRDISGSGAQILCVGQPLPIGTELELRLEIEGHRLVVHGDVVRHLQTGHQYDRVVGVRFVTIDEGDRNLIIRFIYDQQIKRIRTGLI
jgi:c-di-GMP-binding flagellar brake protein YcgR